MILMSPHKASAAPHRACGSQSVPTMMTTLSSSIRGDVFLHLPPPARTRPRTSIAAVITKESSSQSSAESLVSIPASEPSPSLPSLDVSTTSKRTINVSSSLPQNPFEAILEEGRRTATAFCDAIEGLVEAYVDPRDFPPSRDPKIQLADNFAPVGECPPTPCLAVHGTIPECLLGGAYIRNGSNPLFTPRSGYHYFDGPGMLHSVKFPSSKDDINGLPTYCARFTKTNRYRQELKAGKPLFPNSLGDMSSVEGLPRLGLFGLRAALGLIDITNGMGTSNAGMAFYDGKILAMSEDDLPHAVSLQPDGELVTLGRYDFHGGQFLPMCAHPKIDPQTGNLFAFSFNPIINPHIWYFNASPEGKKGIDIPIWLEGGSCLFHDFAVTKNYAIFPESQLVMRVENFLLGKPPMLGDSSKSTRFGVIPRVPSLGSRPRWFDVPDWTAFHYVNAWEEDDEIVLLASCLSPVNDLFDRVPDLVNRLMEVRLNLRTGQSSKQQICSAGIDFGQMDQRRYGSKARYLYMCYYGPWPKFSGIAKVDLDAPRLPRVVNDSADPDLGEPCIVGSRRFPAGTFCNEPFFVPRYEGAAEDDGYILSYVHDEIQDKSELLIMDARSPTLETVSSISLPTRVPYGFHGTFLSRDQINSQRP